LYRRCSYSQSHQLAVQHLFASQEIFDLEHQVQAVPSIGFTMSQWLIVVVYAVLCSLYVRFVQSSIDVITYMVAGCVVLLCTFMLVNKVKQWLILWHVKRLEKLRSVKAALIDRVRSELSYNEAQKILVQYGAAELAAPRPTGNTTATSVNPAQTPAIRQTRRKFSLICN
jgi:uncharacterized membrane protein